MKCHDNFFHLDGHFGFFDFLEKQSQNKKAERLHSFSSVALREAVYQI